VAVGTPNACTRCHLSDAQISPERRALLRQYRDWIDAARRGDEEIRAELARLDRWMLTSMQQWYGKETWGASFASALAAGRERSPDADAALATLAADRKLPGIVRATAVHQRGELRAVDSLQPELAALQDPDPQVRVAAARRLYDAVLPAADAEGQPLNAERLEAAVAPLVRQLVPLLDDPVRVVRAETGRVLARLPRPLVAALLNGAQREQLDRAIDEYILGVMESSDRGGAHLELAVLYETLGREADAEVAYRTALRIEPRITGPRSNLAAWLDRAGQRARARSADGTPSARAEALAAEAARLRREELDLLARDVRLLPDHASLQYRYGLSLYLHGQVAQAEAALQAACRLEPDNDQFLLALALFYDRYERYAEAADIVRQLLRLRPQEPQYEQLRAMIEEKQGAAGRRPE
jgi:Flp pilus assembly protein TadD